MKRQALMLQLLIVVWVSYSNIQHISGQTIDFEKLNRNTAERIAFLNNAAQATQENSAAWNNPTTQRQPPPPPPSPFISLAQPAVQVSAPAWNNPTTVNQPSTPVLANTRTNIAAPTQTTATAQVFTSAAAVATAAVATAAATAFDVRASDAIAYNVLRFAHDVIEQEVNSGSNAKYEIFSPVSVMSSLSLLMLGARGRSYQELRRLLGADSDVSLLSSPAAFHREFGNMLADIQLPIDDPHQQSGRKRQPANWRATKTPGNIRGSERKKPFEHTIKLANGLFAQHDYILNDIYVDLARQVYDSNLMRLDFHHNAHYASTYINDWVKNKTYGKISNIVDDEFSRDTNIVLANALYFKGFWENSFFDGATTYEDFYPDGVQYPPVKVQMMATGGIFPFYDAIEHDCRIIGMPYKGNLTTMYVIQPNQSSRAKLRLLHQYLDASKIESMIERMEQKSALVAFPKMHFQQSFNMKKILRNLQLHDIFIKERSDLSLIAPNGKASYDPTTPVVGTVPRVQTVFRKQPPQQTFGDHSFVFPIQSSETHAGRNGRSKRAAITPLIDRRDRLLELLENQRLEYTGSQPDLYVEDILHKIDFEVNEQGTEAAAATLTYLRRSGTSVLFRADSPFLVMIRHDPTKLVLFYGIINQPE